MGWGGQETELGLMSMVALTLRDPELMDFNGVSLAAERGTDCGARSGSWETRQKLLYYS